MSTTVSDLQHALAGHYKVERDLGAGRYGKFIFVRNARAGRFVLIQNWPGLLRRDSR